VQNEPFCTAAALVTVAIFAAPNGGLHCEIMCTQMKSAHVPHNTMREVSTDRKVAVKGHPNSEHECVNQIQDLGGDRQSKYTDKKKKTT